MISFKGPSSPRRWPRCWESCWTLRFESIISLIPHRKASDRLGWEHFAGLSVIQRKGFSQSDSCSQSQTDKSVCRRSSTLLYITQTFGSSAPFSLLLKLQSPCAYRWVFTDGATTVCTEKSRLFITTNSDCERTLWQDNTKSSCKTLFEEIQVELFCTKTCCDTVHTTRTTEHECNIHKKTEEVARCIKRLLRQSFYYLNISSVVGETWVKNCWKQHPTAWIILWITLFTF